MNPDIEYVDNSLGDNDYVNRNNETERRLYAASNHGIPPPPPAPPPAPIQNTGSDQRVQSHYLPHQQQLPPAIGTFPHHQRNPQSFTGTVPRTHPNQHRPQRLKMPVVLTTPTPQMGSMHQNISGQHPPPYYPPHPSQMTNVSIGIPRVQMQGPIIQQPVNGVMGMPRLAQGGMMMATYDNGWAAPSQAPVNCPPGLEYLAEIDQLLIHQQIEILELLTGFETKNKYMVRNTLGQSVYFAAEESGCCTRQCLGPSRPFDLNFYDHYGNIVMHMYRPLACSSCCCPCCLQSIEVSAPPGNVIGTIHQNWNMFFPRFSVKDITGSTLIKVHGPFWTVSCCCKDVDFKIMTANGKVEIGKVTKQWGGFVQETFTDTDNFSVTFPMDMDITAKALLLAAVFLIDFMYYESNDN